MLETLKKMTAMVLLITLTCVNLIFVGSYFTGEVIAIAEESSLEKQKLKTSNENVEFDAYFVVDEKQVHTKITDINDENINMYLKIKIYEGYLKNGQITLSNTNFKISDKVTNLQYVQSIDTENNIISLNQIAKGIEVEIEIPITAKKDDAYDLNYLSCESIAKFEGTYVNEDGKEEKIDNEKKLSLKLTGEVNAELDEQPEKYITHEENDEKVVILQTTIKSKLADYKLPIKETKITSTVPTINEKRPVEVKVIAQSTMATNGNDIKQMTYKYNKETGILEIVTTNESKDNKVTWTKEGEDEYLVTYLFSLEKDEEIPVSVDFKTESEITVYTNAKPTAGKTQTKILKNLSNENVTNKIDIIKKALYKGYMYSNYETEYSVENNIQIAYEKGNLDIQLYNNKDVFVMQDGTELKADTYYKATVINKEEFEKVLGKDGKINIHGGKNNEQSTVLGTIDNKTEVDENGNYIFKYETKPETIDLVFEGALENDIIGENISIINQKVIESNVNYTYDQIKNMTKLKTTTLSSNKEKEVMAETELKDVEDKTEFKINNNVVSIPTLQENSLELLVTLNNTDNKYELSTNPKIEITLPKEFSNVNVGEISLINEEELRVNSKQINVNESGETVISINLNGKQTEYKLQNTTLVVPITIPEMTQVPSKTVKLKMKYVNELTQKEEEKETEIKLVSKYGLFILNKVNDEKVEENIQKVLPAKSDKQTIQVKQLLINNYDTELTNIEILGRVPNVESKDQNGNYLGSNFDAKLKQKIETNNSNAKVYYSEDATITKDAEGWILDVTDFSNIKSYKIVFENYNMLPETTLEVSYDLEIPANMDYNKTGYNLNVTSYNLEGKLLENTNKIELLTEKLIGNEVIEEEAKIEETNNLKFETVVKSGDNVLKEGDTVYKGQVLKYITRITNISDKNAENISYQATVPEGTVYAEVADDYEYEDNYFVENENVKKVSSDNNTSIPAGESISLEFNVIVKENTGKEIFSTIKINEEDAVETIKNKVEDGKIKLIVRCVDDESVTKYAGDMLALRLDVTNISNETLKNVVVRFNNPQGLTYVTANLNGQESNKLEQYNGNNKTGEISWKLDEIKENETKAIYVDVKTDNMQLTEERKTFSLIAKATMNDGKTYVSNEYTKTVNQGTTKLSVTKATNKVGIVNDGDEITYTISIKNEGIIDANNITLEEKLPQGLEGISISYENYESSEQEEQYSENDEEYYEEEYDDSLDKDDVQDDFNEFEEFDRNSESEPNKQSGNSYNHTYTTSIDELNIPAGKTLIVTIKTKANLKEIQGIDEIANTVIAQGDNIEETHSNEVILEVANIQEEQPKTYTISGVAWLDANKNGMRENAESLLKEIPVKLYNATTDEMVKETLTAEDGKYEFTELDKGKYLVIFEYNEKEYNVTEYQKSGISKKVNSDVIASKKVIDGKEKLVAITDTLEVSSSNKDNIDMGIFVKPKFDLSLNKTISRVTVQNSSGTKTYSYNNEKLTKVEIVAKYLSSSNVLIEYNMAITNEGNIEGYANKVIDYLPKELKFSSDLNPNWYMAQNGELHNLSLENRAIKPGETVNVTLVLTKTMTESDTGLIVNNAEIGESSNAEGIEEYDSSAGNKISREDDFSTAEIVISIKTGKAVFNVVVIIISLIVLASGTILIKKKVLG